MDFVVLLTHISPVAAVFIISGIVLIIVEMFHPGLSVPGVLGSVLLIAGIILTAKTVMDVVILLIVVLAILGIALSLVVHSATKGHLSRAMVLYDTLDKETNNPAMEDLDFFIGKEGITLTPLRPSGCADFEGVRLDVISEGDFINSKTRIIIIKLEGRKIVVSEVKY